MGGIVFGEIAGYMLDHGFGYNLVFGLAGTLHVAAFLVILAAIPVVRPLSLESKFSYRGVQ
jgi:ACS family hexuronate transporter-like MFS transporter